MAGFFRPLNDGYPGESEIGNLPLLNSFLPFVPATAIGRVFQHPDRRARNGFKPRGTNPLHEFIDVTKVGEWVGEAVLSILLTIQQDEWASCLG
jgi:hypothetical protein